MRAKAAYFIVKRFWLEYFRLYYPYRYCSKYSIYDKCAINVAHQEIDLKNPKTNRNNAGFTNEERAKFTQAVQAGMIDTFRYFYPEKEGAYSWWSYQFKAREKNVGWRIDYFMVSEALKQKLQDAKIHPEVFGSDHCPVELDIDL
jgi:exodeoxyribonuclease-3